MKIILINPPFFEVYKGYEKAAKIGASYPPTGLMYLASALLNEGHQVKLLDAAAENLSNHDICLRIDDVKPDLVGITATTPIFCRASDIAKQIKTRSDVPIVIGGYHVTILQDAAFRDNPEFDYAVLGEGERTLVELAHFLENGRNPLEVHGLLLRNGGEVEMTSKRAPTADLDALPFPARSLIGKEKYVWIPPNKSAVPIACVVTQRGCPFQCAFCSQQSMFGRHVRTRSVENVLNELEEIVDIHKITHIIFCDDTFSISKTRVKQICEGIHQRGLEFTWECMCHTNTVDYEILKTMADSGLVRLSFGIESGDDDILKSIHKGVKVAEIEKAFKWAKKAGIETRGSAIIGNPGETRRTAWKTIRFIQQLKYLDQVYINVMVPYPGTEVYELAKKGEAGYRLLSDEYCNYIRYNQAVLEVNDLDVKWLKRFQKLGLWMFYLTPGRILYNLRRSGYRNGLRMAIAMLWGLLKPVGQQTKPSSTNLGDLAN